jgi:hypothetical protein
LELPRSTRTALSDKKPVAFAKGTVFARNGKGDSIYLEPPQVSTNGDGRFLLRFPPEAAAYSTVMSAEGYDLFVSSYRSILISEPFVANRSSGGVLELTRPVPMPKGTRAMLLINESMVHAGFLGKPKLKEGGEPAELAVVTVGSDMPAGSYRLCRASSVEIVRAMSGELPADLECDEAYLAPGGRISLELPD